MADISQVKLPNGDTYNLVDETSGFITGINSTASGANTAWNNKDSVTVLTNATDVSVTKG